MIRGWTWESEAEHAKFWEARQITPDYCEMVILPAAEYDAMTKEIGRLRNGGRLND